MDNFVNSYMEQLRVLAAQRRAEYAVQQAAERKHLTQPKMDYQRLIDNWWRSMPPSIRQHPWQIETIMAAAFKDQPRRPALRCVATALRSAGFVEKRDWTRAGRNRRQWIPPTSNI